MTQDARFLMKTPDGRTWSVEVFGPGKKAKVTDIYSPIGYHEWVTHDQVGVRFWRHADGELVIPSKK